MPYAEFKAPKGVIRVELELSGGRISSIELTGDFFMYPEEALEKLEEKLEGAAVDEDELLSKVEEFYGSTGADTPGLEPEHWVAAITEAAGDR